MTAEELDAFQAELAAGRAVEEALNPEVQKAWAEINRVFGEIQKRQEKKPKKKRRRRK